MKLIIPARHTTQGTTASQEFQRVLSAEQVEELPLYDRVLSQQHIVLEDRVLPDSAPPRQRMNLNSATRKFVSRSNWRPVFPAPSDTYSTSPRLQDVRKAKQNAERMDRDVDLTREAFHLGSRGKHLAFSTGFR